MKILITGHKGFIGQNMVNALKDEHELSFFEWGEQYPDIQGLDWVIHLGAISSTSETDIEKVLRQNLDFSTTLIYDCQKYGVNFQFSSSASIYGLGTNFKEDGMPNPMSPYAWSKYLFERFVKRHQWSGIKVQGFRYFNVYGPYEDHKDQPSPHHAFTKQAIETGVIKLFEGSENFKRDFISVHRVIDIHKKFFNVKESGIWNVGTGKPQSFQHIAKTIVEGTEAMIEYIPMPTHLEKQYQKYTCADLTKLHKTLNEENIC